MEVLEMLVLTRKVGESIQIGGDIKVTVLSAKKDHVRLGIDAPEGLEIWREELYGAARKEKGDTEAGNP